MKLREPQGQLFFVFITEFLLSSLIFCTGKLQTNLNLSHKNFLKHLSNEFEKTIPRRSFLKMNIRKRATTNI